MTENPMKRIAIFITSLRSGGAEKQACILAKTLSLEPMDVTFISFRWKEEASAANLRILDEGKNIKIPVLSGSVASRLNQVRKIIKNGKFDILFNYLTFCDIYGGIFGRLYNVPLVVGGIRNSRLPWHKRIVEKFVHNHISHYSIHNSFAGYEAFTGKGFRKDKSFVIPNCINIEEIPRRQLSAQQKKAIITIGRFVPQKDYATALNAIKTLAEMRDDFKFVIVGYGELEGSIRDMVKKLGLSDIVEIFIRPDNIPELLSTSDIYLSTSIFEGTSNSIMEALMAWLPVVATDVGDNGYMVKDGVNGMLHTCGDVEGIAKSLSVLLDDKNLREQMGVRSSRLLKDNFSVEAFLRRYLDFIDSKLGGKAEVR